MGQGATYCPQSTIKYYTDVVHLGLKAPSGSGHSEWWRSQELKAWLVPPGWSPASAPTDQTQRASCHPFPSPRECQEKDQLCSSTFGTVRWLPSHSNKSRGILHFKPKKQENHQKAFQLLQCPQNISTHIFNSLPMPVS